MTQKLDDEAELFLTATESVSTEGSAFTVENFMQGLADIHANARPAWGPIILDAVQAFDIWFIEDFYRRHPLEFAARWMHIWGIRHTIRRLWSWRRDKKFQALYEAEYAVARHTWEAYGKPATRTVMLGVDVLSDKGGGG